MNECHAVPPCTWFSAMTTAAIIVSINATTKADMPAGHITCDEAHQQTR